MNTTLLFFKISLVIKKLFDKKTGPELQAMKDHFVAAYSDAQLCALVAVGMIVRVFGLAPKQEPGTRSLWLVVGLFIQFLQSLDDPQSTFRAGPNPLDGLVEEGLDELDHLDTYAG
jgi:hypothetical protein